MKGRAPTKSPAFFFVADAASTPVTLNLFQGLN